MIAIWNLGRLARVADRQGFADCRRVLACGVVSGLPLRASK